MNAALGPSSRTTMAEYFDDYVHRVFPARRLAARAGWQWPGDEWADEALQEATFARILGNGDASAWTGIVEFGPGSGKYTRRLLDRTSARLLAYEISAAFVGVLRQRFPDELRTGRLEARWVDWKDNTGLLDDFAQRRLEVDLVLAIDVFMLMDFQSVFVYLLSAACMLRTGGRLFATFADVGSESGWGRLLRDCGRHSAFDGEPCTRFHWITRDMLEAVLPRLGFSAPTIHQGPAGGLDIARLYVDATLERPELALACRSALLSETDRPHAAA